MAEVLDINDDKLTLTVKNKLSKGDEIEIMTPQGNLIYTLDKLWDKKGNEIESALGSGWICQINNPFKEMSPDVLKFALVMKKVDEPIFT